MGSVRSQETTYLALDELAADLRLARRLPPALACRYHALPVAEDGGRITVAMADPADAKARAAVMTALGPESCLVRGDARTIDALLREIWSNEACCPLALLLCRLPSKEADRVREYAQALGGLLGAQVRCENSTGEPGTPPSEALDLDYDLVLLGRPDRALVYRLLSASGPGAGQSRPSGLPFGVLVAQEPRWPLRQILLVVQAERGQESAVDWVVRLAHASGSAVTALGIVPPVPAMYGGRGRLDQGLPALLSSRTALGSRMRQVARSLVTWEIEGVLRLRQGLPEWQIRQEMIAGDYDLIALSTTPQQPVVRRVKGDLVGPLLRWADRPVLVASEPTV
jgi:nucleotide-binding universal stress UspA family protein